MAERAIDYDRPTIIKMVPSLGMDIFMYKDDPGVYLNAFGKPVPAAIAQQAGFDVERLGRLRNRKLAIQRATDAIGVEMDMVDKAARTSVYSAGNYRVVDIGAGRHQIEDADGNNLTPHQTLTIEMARRVCDQMHEAEIAANPPPEDEPLAVASPDPGAVGPGRQLGSGTGSSKRGGKIAP